MQDDLGSDLPKLNRVAPPRLDLSSIHAAQSQQPYAASAPVETGGVVHVLSCTGDEEEDSSDSFDLFGPFTSSPAKAAAAEADSDAEAAEAQGFTDSDDPGEEDLDPTRSSSLQDAVKMLRITV
jgi:hypothetical protein